MNFPKMVDLFCRSHLVWLQFCLCYIFAMHCAIWYYLYNSKNVKNTHGGVLILVKLQASAWVFFTFFTKINTPPWVIFTFFKLYKWYQIAQRIIFLSLTFSVLNSFRSRSCYEFYTLLRLERKLYEEPAWMKN